MNIFSRENKTLVIMGLTFGFVFVDRLSINFLMPFIAKEMDINNAQIGLLASALAVSWAISGYFLSHFCTKFGRKKEVLILSVILFSLCSVLSSIAASFALLLIVRILMGIAEGPVSPISQSILIEESSEHRRGFNIGFVQNACSNLLGSVLAPIVLIYIAENYGWRESFIAAGIPGFIVAFLIYKFIKVDRPVVNKSESQTDFKPKLLLKNRNVIVSIIVCCMMVTWMFSQLTFIPVYLTKVMGYSGYEMGSVMSILGISAVASGLAVPFLSDVFGRTKVFRFVALIAVFCPLSVLFLSADKYIMMVSLFIFYFGLGAIPLVMVIIPSESMPRKYVIATLGIVMGVTEVIGGFCGPSIGGVLADLFGLTAPFYFASTLAGLAFLGSFALIETAPKLLNGKLVSDAS